MNYKVGDKVRVRQWNDMLQGRNYVQLDSGIAIDMLVGYFKEQMEPFCGKIVTIDKIYGDFIYSIKEDNHLYDWTECMFESNENDKASSEPATSSEAITSILTNRQWLESLSDEDLAKFLHTCRKCGTCAFEHRPTNCYLEDACTIGRIKWLKQKHKESEQ